MVSGNAARLCSSSHIQPRPFVRCARGRYCSIAADWCLTARPTTPSASIERCSTPATGQSCEPKLPDDGTVNASILGVAIGIDRHGAEPVLSESSKHLGIRPTSALLQTVPLLQ